MKKIILILMILMLSIATVSAQQVVKTIYTKDFFIDATAYPLKSCNIKANYESQTCQYLYACYVVMPKGTTTLDNAVMKECQDITDTKKATLHVSFAPPKGVQWAVTTFVVVMDYTYNNATYQWGSALSIPMDYRNAEMIVSLCPEGQMLKNNLCYNAQPVCLNTYSTNLCNNPYQLYILDYGLGFEFNNPAHFCSDRDFDMVCDVTISHLCADSNNNGVCDADDLAIQDVSCIDANKNYVCDNVEAEGVFCRTNYEPVHCGEGLSCVTYPNKCFAEGCGCLNPINGTCVPIYANLCFLDKDCISPCDGVVGKCKNPDGNYNRCFFTGECNPRTIQCMVDTDCPASPCKGVVFQCTSQNRCESIGECISQPIPPQTFWQKLSAIWNSFLVWLSGLWS